jgi:hypothetical protein
VTPIVQDITAGILTKQARWIIRWYILRYILRGTASVRATPSSSTHTDTTVHRHATRDGPSQPRGSLWYSQFRRVQSREFATQFIFNYRRLETDYSGHGAVRYRTGSGTLLAVARVLR